MPRVVLSTGVSVGAKMSMPSCRRPPDRALPHESTNRGARRAASGLGSAAAGFSMARVYTNHARSMSGRVASARKDTPSVTNSTRAHNFMETFHFTRTATAVANSGGDMKWAELESMTAEGGGHLRGPRQRGVGSPAACRHSTHGRGHYERRAVTGCESP